MCFLYLTIFSGFYAKAEENYKSAITLCMETVDQKRLSASLMGIGTVYPKERLVKYIKNQTFEMEISTDAKVAFEIPYIYEN